MSWQTRFDINFVIGDWSHDGHNQSREFTIESNKPVEHLREVHFSCMSKFGFDIGDICSKYEDRDITKFKEKLESLCLNIENYAEKCSNDGDITYVINDPDKLVKLWIRILMRLDDSLTLFIVQKNELPTMHFSGFDDKKRHLNVPGYGLFE